MTLALNCGGIPRAFLQAVGSGPRGCGSAPLPSGDGFVIPGDSCATLLADLADVADSPGPVGKGLALSGDAPLGFDDAPSGFDSSLAVLDNSGDPASALAENEKGAQRVLPVLPWLHLALHAEKLWGMRLQEADQTL